MCSPRNVKYNPTYLKSCQQKFYYALGFYISADYLFSHFLELKSTFFTSLHFAPPSNVLKRFRYLEVSNRVRNWNKVKNYIFQGSKLQLCQLEITIFIYKLMWQRSFINSVSFCSLNLIVSLAEMKAKLSF